MYLHILYNAFHFPACIHVPVCMDSVGMQSTFPCLLSKNHLCHDCKNESRCTQVNNCMCQSYYCHIHYSIYVWARRLSVLGINFAIVPQGKELQYTTYNIYFVSSKWAITSQERNLNNILENNHQQKKVEEKNRNETQNYKKIKNWNKNGLGRGLQKKKGRKNALMQRRTAGGKTN